MGQVLSVVVFHFVLCNNGQNHFSEELMNDQMNVPVSPDPAGFSGWFRTWINAVSKPSEQAYATMAEHPDAQSYNRAFIWVFLAGTVSAIISGLLRGILELAGFNTQIQLPALSQYLGNATPRGGLASIGIALCASPLSGVLAVLGFAIFVGVIQWVARMFKGVGNFSQLAYVTAAISVPFTLVTSFLTPFAAIKIVGLCVNSISLILGLYAIYLQLLAVKAVNKFGWGEAAGSYFIPLILIVCICGCVAVGLGSILGAGFSELLKQRITP
jgi:hypothetical protein